jgi:hypothetical protein
LGSGRGAASRPRRAAYLREPPGRTVVVGQPTSPCLRLARGRQETAPVDPETSTNVGQRDGRELFEQVRCFEYFSQLPSNLILERSKSDGALGDELIEARREIRERASARLVIGPEERPQVEVQRAREHDELAKGDCIDDLFVEALQIAVCLIRDPEQVGELSRIATARLPSLGQALRLTRCDEISRLEESPPP